ncbi:MAG: YceI family protein [Wenzhouxiangellaceae bacterium]|nr:YceI family protein [Wenzhouxiangellaceae bacterium]
MNKAGPGHAAASATRVKCIRKRIDSTTSWLTSSGLAVIALTLAAQAAAEPETFEIDPEHFSIGFQIEHVGYADVIGLFTEASGQFVYDEQSRELQSGHVEVRADSVFTAHDKRDRHVRDSDFLDTERHEIIRFEAIEFRPDDDSGGTLTGDLTLLGQTHPVELDVTINKAAEYPFGHGKYTLGVSARTTIERSRWGMSYAVDNGLVGDEVDLKLEFEALRK